MLLDVFVVAVFVLFICTAVLQSVGKNISLSVHQDVSKWWKRHQRARVLWFCWQARQITRSAANARMRKNVHVYTYLVGPVQQPPLAVRRFEQKSPYLYESLKHTLLIEAIIGNVFSVLRGIRGLHRLDLQLPVCAHWRIGKWGVKEG